MAFHRVQRIDQFGPFAYNKSACGVAKIVAPEAIYSLPTHWLSRILMSISPEVIALEKEAESLKAEGKLSEAIEKYSAALTLDDTFVRGHFAIALLYSKTNEFEKSVEHGEKAYSLEKDPINAAFLSQIYQFAFEGTRDPKFIQKAEGANTNL